MIVSSLVSFVNVAHGVISLRSNDVVVKVAQLIEVKSLHAPYKARDKPDNQTERTRDKQIDHGVTNERGLIASMRSTTSAVSIGSA